MAKKKAEENKERFKAFTNQATDGITVADLEGNYIFINPAFCKMSGYTEEELLKMTVYDMRADSQTHDSFFESKTRQGEPIEVKLKRKDQTEYYTEIIGKIIKLNNQEFVLGTIRDITERKKAEHDLKESEERFTLAMKASNDGSLQSEFGNQ
ncbi:MAG: PAS domain S-box protein [Lentimicrobium sp.]|nr:PAS domain S-box protein [Lentimicrobium sp.]